MSGFLHRLAAQAMGSRNNTLHTAARLPYAVTPAPVFNEESDRKTTPLNAMGNRQYLEGNSAAELDHQPGKNHRRDNIRAEPGALTDENGALADENKNTPLSPEVLVAQAATESSPKPDRENTQPSSVNFRLQQAEKTVYKTVAGVPHLLDEKIKTQIPLDYSASKFFTRDEPNSTYTGSAAPPPLMPLQNPARPPASKPGAVAQQGEPRGTSSQSRLEETTEVHVSIGRIEVTAMHEAPPPKRQAPTTAKAMTLDEYLTRRQRQA